MSSTLLKVARENSSVVAVVGEAHLQGIKKHWKQPVVVGEHLVICMIYSNRLFRSIFIT